MIPESPCGACFAGSSPGIFDGVPARHRTDSLSSAVNNLSDLEEFTDRYKGLLKYYGLEPERIQVRKANKNAV